MQNLVIFEFVTVKAEYVIMSSRIVVITSQHYDGNGVYHDIIDNPAVSSIGGCGPLVVHDSRRGVVGLQGRASL